MKESDFIKIYKKKTKVKNYKAAKKKIDLFWNALFKALDDGGKVVIKNWGIFEKKDVKARKVVLPKWTDVLYTKPKRVMKFRVGLGLIERINKNNEGDEQKVSTKVHNETGTEAMTQKENKNLYKNNKKI